MNYIKRGNDPHARRGYVENTVWSGGNVVSVDKEWKKFRIIVMECTNDVYGMRRVAVAEKRSFEEWPWRRDCDKYVGYRAQRAAVKLAVKVTKRMVD